MSVDPRLSDRKSTFIRHPAVARLLSEEAPTRCPRAAIRGRVARAVSEAKGWGWDGPPFDMDVMASLRGLKVQVVEGLNHDQDGFLLPGHPPTIHISSSMPAVRARYTVAHEIVHTLLPDLNTSDGERHWVYRHGGQSPVEQLCQVGASELLMPSTALLVSLAGRAESLEVAEELGRTFEVSLEAAARNIVDLAAGDYALILLQLMNKPRELAGEDQLALPGLNAGPPEKRLRVLYSWTSRTWDHHFFPRYKSVPDVSVAYEALGTTGHTPGVAEAVEDWGGMAGVQWCRIQATRVWSESEPTVLCMLRGLGSANGD